MILFSAFMGYAEIIFYIQLIFCFQKLKNTYVVSFQFVKDVSDLFVCQVADWAYFCI